MSDKKNPAGENAGPQNELHDDSEVTNVSSVEPAEQSSGSESLNTLIADLQAQLLKAQNDTLYLRAEFDNSRRQAIKERSELVKYGGERLAKDLLETLDIFETALENEVTADNWQAFVKGVQLTAQQLKTTLAKHNITPVESVGQPFDPNVHEALGSEPTDSLPPGHVTKVFKKPYKYADKLLRHGQVIVAKAKE